MDTHTPPSRCLNCEAPLTGPYCAQCGQHAHHSARSLAALFEDAWHLITHMEGRFWGTLRPLLLRPGFLTLEYFAEHRARYMPPFRLYFVISLIFFGLSTFAADIGTHSDANVNAQLTPEDKADLQQMRAVVRKAVGSAPTIIIPGADADEDSAPAGGSAAASTNSPPETEEQRRARLTTSCSKIPASGWSTRIARTVCLRVAADNSKSLGREFRELLPKMMFVFLPFMALVMLPLYRHPRRYYVEHLVFYLHLHAAVFLAFLLDVLYARATGLFPALTAGVSWLGTVVGLYVIWYVYAAMRRYYGQGRGRTLAKCVVIGLAYGVFLVIAMSITGVLSAVMA
ncbi:MAG TPA: DUF3667 domain-containing protein [Steroidobacteraceae bacterium]|nr:DUF3667 domain-containing protein [Steroidobacteraceae bacterium]